MADEIHNPEAPVLFEYDARFARATYPFPFGGYDDVLEEIIERAGLQYPDTFLVLGAGLGNLCALLDFEGHEVWVIEPDAQRRRALFERVPDAHIIAHDWRADAWVDALPNDVRFKRVVSAYHLHDLTPEARLDLIDRVFDAVPMKKGSMVVGDICFETVEEHKDARQRYVDVWDPGAHYWLGDRDLERLIARGYNVSYGQVAPCAGVWRIK